MKKNKIIFLDIDGVLCPYPKWQKGWIGNKNNRLKAACCRNLAHVLELTDARIVLSSSWRLFTESLSSLYEQLARFGIKETHFVGYTPDLRQGVLQRTHNELRYLEICECIAKFDINHYIIIDDFDLERFDAARIVRTSRYKGLTTKLRDQCIEKLNRS